MTAFLQAFSAPRRVFAGVMGMLLLGSLMLATTGKTEAAVARPVWSATPCQAEVPVSISAPRPVFAAWYHRVLGNRARMIQVATIFMIVGILMLMWNKGK